MCIIKKIAKTVKLEKEIRTLKQQRDWGVEAIREHEADGLEFLYRAMLNGTVLIDNDIADAYREIKAVWA